MIRFVASIALLALGVVAGCEEAPPIPPDARVAYDTVGGVVHVVSGSRGAWLRGGAWNVDRQGVAIGAAQGPEPYVFGQIAGVVVGRDGQIYVGDRQAAEVRVFSPDGVFMRRFGGPGDGPGEFREINGLGRAPEGIAVLDGELGRVTIFRPGGTVARTIALSQPSGEMESGAPVRIDTRGRYYHPVALSSTPGRERMAMIVHGRDGLPEDTIPMARLHDEPVGPFQPVPSVAVGPDGRIYFAPGDDYRITVLAPQGDTLRVLRRRVRPRPVTATERDSALVLVRQQSAELPATKPIIAGLVVDDLGNLWVETFGDAHWSQVEWAVHDPGGRYLGAVAVPRMAVTHIGPDFVAGADRDEDGVQRAVVLPIRR